jgi:hypothetical protein
MSDKVLVMTRGYGEALSLVVRDNVITLYAIRGTEEKSYQWTFNSHAEASLEFEKNEIFATLRGFVTKEKRYA